MKSQLQDEMLTTGIDTQMKSDVTSALISEAKDETIPTR